MFYRVAEVWCAVLALASALRKAAQPPHHVDDPATEVAHPPSADRTLKESLESTWASELLADSDFKQALRAQLLKVPVNMVESVSHVPFNSSQGLPRPRVCSVVSSSHSVLAAEAGAAIDSVDGLVMRFNTAPTKSFERWVGSRTDIRVVNDQIPCKWMEADHDSPKSENGTLLLNNFGKQLQMKCLQRLRAKTNRLYSLHFEPMNNGLYTVMQTLCKKMSGGKPKAGGAPDECTVATTMLNKKKPWVTSGMVGLMMLLNMCEEVRHYGFIPVAEGSSADNCKEHYWLNTSKCSNNGKHTLSLEHALWAAVSTRGKVPGEGIIPGVVRLQDSPFAITKEQPGWGVVPARDRRRNKKSSPTGATTTVEAAAKEA